MLVNKSQGFTLIELIIVLVIVGIISSIAMPSYIENVRTSHRTDAEMTMQRVAMSLERFYTTYGKIMDASGETYDLAKNFGNACVPRIDNCSAGNSEIRYFITLETTTSTYKITATPKNDQLNDKCGELTLDSTNTKGISGNQMSVAECW